jgi:hypothetical protein
VGPRAGLDDAEKKKSCPYLDSNVDLSFVHPVASRYTESDITAPGIRTLQKLTLEKSHERGVK